MKFTMIKDIYNALQRYSNYMSKDERNYQFYVSLNSVDSFDIQGSIDIYKSDNTISFDYYDDVLCEDIMYAIGVDDIESVDIINGVCVIHWNNSGKHETVTIFSKRK